MDSLWIPPIITGIFTALAAWIATRNSIKKVNTKVDTVITQNEEQGERITAVHQELNSRLDQWKEEVETHIKTAVKAAMAEGLAAGIELERSRIERKNER